MALSRFFDCATLIFLIFGLSRVGVISIETNGCEKRCTCANFIMDCRGQDFVSFPQNVSSDIRAIYLTDNKIKTVSQIPQEAELQTLVLTSNLITKLEYDAFDNLDNLKTLYLSNNSISMIEDDIFEWNPLKLEALYLDGNKLEFIQHFLFYDLEELTDLYLQNNRITFIHPHAFLQLKSLRNLRLDGNKLHTFNHKWIEKLQSNAFAILRFDHNPWSCDCAMNTSQIWLNKEKKSKWFLDLTSADPIVCTQPTQHKGKQLTNLTTDKLVKICDSPKITGISAPTKLDRGRDILLRCVYDNTLFPVPSVSWTAPNKDVYRLNTANNFDGIEVHQDGSLLISNLSEIDKGKYTCNVTNVKGMFSASTEITLSDKPYKPKPTEHGKVTTTQTPQYIVTETPDSNIISVIHKDCPEGCQCVSRHIDCAGDGGKARDVVPPDIPADALTINLASNSLKELGPNDFKKFTKLEELRLDNNDIEKIHPDAFSTLKGLTTLTLQQNKLTSIAENTFLKLESLNVLVLDKNKLTKLSRNMFKGLTDLQWLYVRHNFVQTVADSAFAPLEKIKFIHLESNQIGVLYPAVVKNLMKMSPPTIKKVFVDDNAFMCDCMMEELREFVTGKTINEDLFGDGIFCSYPPAFADVQLKSVSVKLECDEVVSAASPELPGGNYSGLLFGGIALGVVLTIIMAVLWRKYGRRIRKSGHSYNYSNINGNDESERRGLTDSGTSGTEAFV